MMDDGATEWNDARCNSGYILRSLLCGEATIEVKSSRVRTLRFNINLGTRI